MCDDGRQRRRQCRNWMQQTEKNRSRPIRWDSSISLVDCLLIWAGEGARQRVSVYVYTNTRRCLYTRKTNAHTYTLNVLSCFLHSFCSCRALCLRKLRFDAASPEYTLNTHVHTHVQYTNFVCLCVLLYLCLCDVSVTNWIKSKHSSTRANWIWMDCDMWVVYRIGTLAIQMRARTTLHTAAAEWNWCLCMFFFLLFVGRCVPLLGHLALCYLLLIINLVIFFHTIFCALCVTMKRNTFRIPTGLDINYMYIIHGWLFCYTVKDRGELICFGVELGWLLTASLSVC